MNSEFPEVVSGRSGPSTQQTSSAEPLTVLSATGPSRTGWGRFQRVLVAGLGGRPVFSTTSRGVEFAVMVASAGARAIVLLQMFPSVTAGIRSSPRPSLYGAFFALGAGWSVGYIWLVIHARRPVPWVARVDISVAASCLLLQTAVVSDAQPFDSWISWAYVFALNVLSVSGCARLPRAELIGAVVVLSALYLATRLTGDRAVDAAVLSNAVSMFIFPILTRTFSGYIRRLGTDADLARAEAEATARKAERERHQLLLHDSATILRLLAAGELPPELEEAVRRQAATESMRIRRFLDDRYLTEVPAEDLTSAGQRAPLIDVVQQVVDAFSDLPIDLVVDLAAGVALDRPRAAAVQLAMTGLLNNIRVHAGAGHVVIHGDWDETGSEWELLVRDDGVGFDPERTTEGFGLAIQVRKSLVAHNISVVVDSSPGNGTVAVLRGRGDVTNSRAVGRALRDAHHE